MLEIIQLTHNLDKGTIHRCAILDSVLIVMMEFDMGCHSLEILSSRFKSGGIRDHSSEEQYP